MQRRGVAVVAEAKYESRCASGRTARAAFAVLALLLATPIRTASADAFPLPRTPHLAASTNDPADESRCDLDEDGNGLDDEMELRIARAAAPELRFDRNENAREPDEPYTLFNIRRALGRPGVLAIRYALLYKRDGGAVYSLLCGTAHNGDSESLTVDVKVTEGFSGWVGEVIQINGRTSFVRSGTHPVVFLSAGKKHQYYAPGLYRFGANCPDGADGNGARVTPGTSVVRRIGDDLVTTPHSSLFHAPLFFDSDGKAADVTRDGARPWKSNAPLFDDRSGWWNACLAGLHPTDRSRWRPATRYLTSNNLGPVFPGEAIEGQCFRGGLGGDCTVADPVWFVMSDKLADATNGDSLKVGGVLDSDGDGRPELSGLLSLSGSPFAFKKTDAFPDDPRDGLGNGALDVCEFLQPFAATATARSRVRPADGLVVPIARRPIDSANAILDALKGAQGHDPVEPDLLLAGRGSLAESAAVVDPEAGSLRWFDSLLRVWARSGASLALVRDRVGATWTLRGLRVFALGGREAGALVDRLQLWSAQGALLDGQFRTD